MNIWKSNTKRSKKGQTSGSRRVCSSLGEDGSEDINDANASGLPDVLLTHSLIGSTNHSSSQLPSSGYFGEVEERPPLYPNTTDYYGKRRTLDSSADYSRVTNSESYAIDEGSPGDPIRQKETKRRGRTEYDLQPVSVGNHRVPIDGSNNYTNWQPVSQYVNSTSEGASINPYSFGYNEESIPHPTSYDYHTIGSTRDRSQGNSNYKQLQENSKSLRYRSASSEPKSKERRRDRRSRCSSATRAKNLNGQQPTQSQTNNHRTQYIDNSQQSFNFSHQGSENYLTNYAEQQNQQLAQQKDIFQSIPTPNCSTMQYNQATPNDPLTFAEDYRSQQSFSNNQPDPSLPMSHSNQSSWQAMGLPQQTVYDDDNRNTRQQQQPLYHETGSPMFSQDTFKNSGVYDAAQQLQRMSFADPLATESQEPTAPQFPSKPPDGGGEYGYRVPDLDGLLTQSSSSQPANLPMVLSAATRLHHMRRTVASSSRPFLPLGVIVNAIFKTRDWLYVRTAHGAEGFVPYHVCLPLGILPANNRIQNQQLDSTPSAAWEISPQTDTGAGAMTQERGRCRERRRPAPQAEITITTNQTDLQKLQPHSSDML